MVIVGVPPVRTLDVFGPAEVFGDANWLHDGDPNYAVTIVSACRERVVPSYIEKPLYTDQSFRDFRGSIDTLLVAGSVGQMRYEADFLDWLRDQSAKARRFGSICTGALILAKAGLLDGRRATTHWSWCDELARDYPKVKVDPSPIYVRDGNCYTSAGVTAGIDLALALVEEDLGRRLALRVAQMPLRALIGFQPVSDAAFKLSLIAAGAKQQFFQVLVVYRVANRLVPAKLDRGQLGGVPKFLAPLLRKTQYRLLQRIESFWHKWHCPSAWSIRHGRRGRLVRSKSVPMTYAFLSWTTLLAVRPLMASSICLAM